MPPIFEFRDEAHRRSAKWALLAIAGSVAVLLSVSRCGAAGAPAELPETANRAVSGLPVTEADLKAIEVAMRDEPAALTWALSPTRTLTVSVADDGTSREGLAGYFCMDVAQALTVDIVNDADKARLLGHEACAERPGINAR